MNLWLPHQHAPRPVHNSTISTMSDSSADGLPAAAAGTLLLLLLCAARGAAALYALTAAMDGRRSRRTSPWHAGLIIRQGRKTESCTFDCLAFQCQPWDTGWWWGWAGCWPCQCLPPPAPSHTSTALPTSSCCACRLLLAAGYLLAVPMLLLRVPAAMVLPAVAHVPFFLRMALVALLTNLLLSVHDDVEKERRAAARRAATHQYSLPDRGEPWTAEALTQEFRLRVTAAFAHPSPHATMLEDAAFIDAVVAELVDADADGHLDANGVSAATALCASADDFTYAAASAAERVLTTRALVGGDGDGGAGVSLLGGERPRWPSAPNWAVVFVRGVGWVHVADLANGAKPMAMVWLRGLLLRGCRLARVLSCGGLVGVRRLRAAKRVLNTLRRNPWAFMLFACGDVEPHPGPSAAARQRRRARARAARAVPTGRSVLEMTCMFQNVRGLSCAAKRDAYLRSVREKFDIVALAETNCSRDKEREWSKDWHGGATFWSSGGGGDGAAPPGAAADGHGDGGGDGGGADAAAGGTFCRGVALLVSDKILLTEVKQHGDSDGRLLLVSATVFHEHKVLFIVSYAPSGDDGLQRDFFDALPGTVRSHVPDVASRHVVWLGDHNNVENVALDQHPPNRAQRCVQGARALADAVTSLGVRDAFRVCSPTAIEFTHVPDGPITALTHTSRRLDRIYVSPQMAAGRVVPRLAGVWHVRARDPIVAPHFLKDGSMTSRPSDHGAVACCVALSHHQRVKPKWSFDSGILLDEGCFTKIRDAIVAVLASTDGAHERMERIKDAARDVHNAVVRDRRDRRAEESRLSAAVALCDDRLGRGLRPAMAPVDDATRQQLEEQRQRDLKALDALLDQRAREWLQRRGHEEHMDSRPTKAFFQRLSQEDPERHMPVEMVRDANDAVIHDADAIARSASHSFAKRFNQPKEADAKRVEHARSQLLQHVRPLPRDAKKKVDATSILSREHVLHAINQMPLHKTPGDDGFPTEFYRAYGTLLAPLLAEMYEDCLEAEEMHPHMRRATVSLIYKAKGSRLSWKNYRPIAVSCVEYKILAKAMQLSLDDVCTPARHQPDPGRLPAGEVHRRSHRPCPAAY